MSFTANVTLRKGDTGHMQGAHKRQRMEPIYYFANMGNNRVALARSGDARRLTSLRKYSSCFYSDIDLRAAISQRKDLQTFHVQDLLLPTVSLGTRQAMLSPYWGIQPLFCNEVDETLFIQRQDPADFVENYAFFAQTMSLMDPTTLPAWGRLPVDQFTEIDFSALNKMPIGKQLSAQESMYDDSFCLDFNTILAFMLLPMDTFVGKFVFDRNKDSRKLGELGIHEGKTVQHREIASEILESATHSDIIGAFISFTLDEDKIIFKLEGASEHFGQPSPEEMRQVAEKIVEMLSMRRFLDVTIEKGKFASDMVVTSRFPQIDTPIYRDFGELVVFSDSPLSPLDIAFTQGREAVTTSQFAGW